MVSITNIITPKVSTIREGRPRRAFVARVAFNRSTGTTAYGALDVIAEPGGNRVIEFPDCAVQKGGSGVIHRISVATEDVTGNLHAHLFDERPTEFADNAVFTMADSDRNILIGSQVLNIAVLTTVGAVYTHGAAQTLGPFSFVCADDSTSLFMHLLTIAGFTPTSASRIVVTLHGEQDL